MNYDFKTDCDSNNNCNSNAKNSSEIDLDNLTFDFMNICLILLIYVINLIMLRIHFLLITRIVKQLLIMNRMKI